MPELVLYHFENCAYCKIVNNYIQKNEIDVKLKDIYQDPEASEELLKIGGKKQVPCLFVDNKPIYESHQIIQWLKNNLNGKIGLQP